MTGTGACATTLWIVHSADRPDPGHLALLSMSERRQCSRFRQAERQARYACGRALVRLALAELCAADPQSFLIEAGVNRRPALAGPSRDRWPRIDFNLSSTAGLVACAIVQGARVGIDLERPGRIATDDALVQRVTSTPERRWLAASDDAQTDFYRLWTLKEAVAKADGEGLGLPFDQITVLPGVRGDVTVDLDAMGAQADHWRIYSLDVSVPAALAVRFDNAESQTLTLAPDFSAPLPPGADFRAAPVSLLAASAAG